MVEVPHQHCAALTLHCTVKKRSFFDSDAPSPASQQLQAVPLYRERKGEWRRKPSYRFWYRLPVNTT
jgi:hypothetical protein